MVYVIFVGDRVYYNSIMLVCVLEQLTLGWWFIIESRGLIVLLEWLGDNPVLTRVAYF